MVFAMSSTRFNREFAAEYAQLVPQLAKRDAKRLRFGARAHGYVALPPSDAALPLPVPADFAAFIREISAGGFGPYYGLLAPTTLPERVWQVAALPSLLPDGNDEAAAQAVAGANLDPWPGSLPIAKLGCGYTALLVLNGPATGQVWLDARAVGLIAPIAPTFTAFVLDGLHRSSQAMLPLGYVPLDVCALPNALAGYLAVWEQRHNVEPGELTSGQLREALSNLGAGSIALAAQMATPLHAENAGVNPCVVCAQVVDRLADAGLASTVLAWHDETR